MVKLAVVLLAVWLVAVVSSMQLALAGIELGLGCLKSSEVKRLLEKEPEKRTSDEWKKLVAGANKALSNAKCMDIETALEIFQHVDGEYGAKLDRSEADILINFRNISDDKCTKEDSPISKEFGKLLLHIIRNKPKFAELYKAARASLNHYTKICGLEDRYDTIVQRYVSTAAANKYTLADQLLGESHGLWKGKVHFSLVSLLWTISVISNPNFGLVSEIKCEEEKFIAKLAKGLKYDSLNLFGLTDYANDAVKNYFKACGYEDRFKLVAEAVFTGDEKRTTLVSYLIQSNLKDQENELFPRIKRVLDLTSLDTTDKKNCNGVNVTNDLVDRIQHLEDPVLFKYVLTILERHLTTCGYAEQFRRLVKEFLEGEANNGKLIESFPAKAVKLDDHFCRFFWQRTYARLVDLATTRYSKGQFIDKFYGLVGSPWVEELRHCAFNLEEDDGKLAAEKLEKLIKTIKVMITSGVNSNFRKN